MPRFFKQCIRNECETSATQKAMSEQSLDTSLAVQALSGEQLSELQQVRQENLTLTANVAVLEERMAEREAAAAASEAMLKSTIAERDARIENLEQELCDAKGHCGRQNYKLGEMRGLQTKVATLEGDLNTLRVKLGEAGIKLELEVNRRKEAEARASTEIAPVVAIIQNAIVTAMGEARKQQAQAFAIAANTTQEKHVKALVAAAVPALVAAMAEPRSEPADDNEDDDMATQPPAAASGKRARRG